MDDMNSTERRGQRRRIESSVLLRNSDGTRIQAQLFDISEFGCAIFAPDAHLKIGRIYTLKTPGVELIGATMAWSKDHHAGLEFIEPLHPSVAKHLVKMFPATMESPFLPNGSPSWNGSAQSEIN